MYQINPVLTQVSSEDLVLLRQAEPAIAFQVQEQVTLACLRTGEKFPDIVGSRAVLDQAIAAAIVAQS